MTPPPTSAHRQVITNLVMTLGPSGQWVVDIDARVIEVRHLASGAETPQIVRAAESMRWTPVSTAPPLESAVGKILAEEWGRPVAFRNRNVLSERLYRLVTSHS